MARARRRFVLVPLALLSFLLLSSCGSSDGGSSGSDETPAVSDSGAVAPAGLVKSGTLTACSDTPYEPFEFKANGEDTGYDIDLLRGVATHAGLKLTVKDLPFDGILASLASGDCDVVASAVTITPERAKQVAFSDPYFDADQSLLVKSAKAGELSALAKLSGKTIGVQSGTTGETYAKEKAPGATIKGFEDSDGLFSALESGQIDAILQDLPVNAYRATKDDSIKIVETYKTGEQYGYAVAKDKPKVLAFINAGLKALKKSGDFDTTYTKYFGAPKS